ncbi:MAG: polysaccharide deacetylase family protein [Saprospiraceae bacterium]|nr:polysaccharide deacetylase family protein [Lewinella sp.]
MSTEKQSQLRFSIVIPTYQRKEVVKASVKALSRLEFAGGLEAVVVVDGSTDGTAEALRSLDLPFPFRVIEQENQGASTARNRGATAATGEIILFLDDDMEAHPQLLNEHDRSHREGADAVIGHIPLHPDSPQNFLSELVGQWAEERVSELQAVHGKLPFNEIMTGQLSIARETFFALGGFNTKFTHGGSFGNEDLDFGLRLQERGYHITFNPQAISWQKYVVSPRQYLRQYRQAGRADVLFARLHPEHTAHLFTRTQRPSDRLVWRWWRPLLRWGILSLLERGMQGPRLARLFSRLVDLEYYRGVRDGGGIPGPASLRVLCYHAVSDLAGATVIEPYGIPPDQFRRQLDLLQRWGFQFIDVHEFFRYLDRKAGLPRRAVLLTFDDCYRDILEAALPILREKGIPAVAFAVSRLKTNVWDRPLGAPSLHLLDADGLRALTREGVVIGSHSRYHPMLNRISPAQLKEEIEGSVSDLEAMGLERPSLLAYPYGEYNEKVQQAARKAGLRAAFTVEPGLVRSGTDYYRLPRIEILRKHTGWRLLWRVLRVN